MTTISNLAPWRVLVKHRKKDEYLSWGEIFIWQALNFLFALPIILVALTLLHSTASRAFINWLTIVGAWLLLSLIPQVRTRQVRLVNRRVDKKKSRTPSGA
jgi:hypothetical protein